MLLGMPRSPAQLLRGALGAQGAGTAGCPCRTVPSLAVAAGQGTELAAYTGLSPSAPAGQAAPCARVGAGEAVGSVGSWGCPCARQLEHSCQGSLGALLRILSQLTSLNRILRLVI